MLYAILDLGSNTFNLLIANSNNFYDYIENNKIPVKLLKNNAKNYISNSAQQRGINALLKHINTIKKHNVKQIYAFATSAIRSSNNGQQYTKKIKEKTGLTINVIDGKKEAELIAKGVQNNLNLSKGKYLLIDIGGGSTEFIIADNNKTYWTKSYNLGAARLLNKFNPNEPISLNEIENIHSYLKKNLYKLIKKIKKNNIIGLIGCSGSFETLAAMLIEENNKISDLNHFCFNLNQLNKLHQTLLQSTYKERLKMKGLVPMRADMIVISSIFIIFILNKLNVNQLLLSKFALKEGVLSTLNKKNSWQKSLL